MIGAGAWAAAARRVAAALEAERALIRAGDLEGVARHAAALGAALADFAALRPPSGSAAEAALHAIRGSARRNRALLEAMLDGARSAREDLARMAQARMRLGYDPAGAPLGAAGPPRRDRRA